MAEAVVTSESCQRSQGNGVGEEDLSSRIDPHLAITKHTCIQFTFLTIYLLLNNEEPQK